MASNEGRARENHMRRRSTGWLFAAGVGLAVTLAYLFDSQKGAARRRRIAGQFDTFTRQVRQQYQEAMEGGLHPSLPYQTDGRLWTPGTRLMASAVGGSLALYGFRSVRRLRHADDDRWAASSRIQRQLTNIVGLQSAGR